jgi:hypothetical protein
MTARLLVVPQFRRVRESHHILLIISMSFTHPRDRVGGPPALDKPAAVLGRVDPDAGLVHEADGDRVAEFEDAELLQLLGLFEGGERPERQQEVAAISIEAQVEEAEGRAGGGRRGGRGSGSGRNKGRSVFDLDPLPVPDDEDTKGGGLTPNSSSMRRTG